MRYEGTDEEGYGGVSNVGLMPQPVAKGNRLVLQVRAQDVKPTTCSTCKACCRFAVFWQADPPSQTGLQLATCHPPPSEPTLSRTRAMSLSWSSQLHARCRRNMLPHAQPGPGERNAAPGQCIEVHAKRNSYF